jgi:hypothetical protein
MNRIFNEAKNLFEIYCELELKNDEDEPLITKVYPPTYKDNEVLKILGNFVFPYRKVER